MAKISEHNNLGDSMKGPMDQFEKIKTEANRLYKDHKFLAAESQYSAAYNYLLNCLRQRKSLLPSSGNAELSKKEEPSGTKQVSGKVTTNGFSAPEIGKRPNGVVQNDHNKSKDDAPGTKDASQEEKEVNDAVAKVLCNRALSRLRLEQYGAALFDANTALRYSPAYTKAYYRRGSANFALGRYRDALKDFKVVCNLAPNDKDAVTKRKECEKTLKEIAFYEAIDTGKDKINVADSIDLSSYVVEDAYDGPRLPDDGQVTIEFVEKLIETFKAQGKLATKYALMIVLAAKKLFDAMPPVVDYAVEKDAQITVCGDTHGQYYDLCNIFDINGLPSPENPYLFNGDFVDRGSFSVELILTLFALKVWSPESLHLTRGNHETCAMNMMYGFEGEVKSKYSPKMYELFAETFRSLPLAYILDGSSVPGGKKAIVLHGGLFSKDGVMLEDLRNIHRFREPQNGLMSEMLWSDPQKEMGRGPSKRGTGIAFGPDVTERFLEENGLDLVVRSHEMKEQGYEVEANGKLITIFSAPNYCDQLGNKGAFIKFCSDMDPDFTQFEAVPHPNVPAMTYARHLRMMGL